MAERDIWHKKRLTDQHNEWENGPRCAPSPPITRQCSNCRKQCKCLTWTLVKKNNGYWQCAARDLSPTAPPPSSPTFSPTIVPPVVALRWHFLLTSQIYSSPHPAQLEPFTSKERKAIGRRENELMGEGVGRMGSHFIAKRGLAANFERQLRQEEGFDGPIVLLLLAQPKHHLFGH